jgi:glutamyl-tRNA synthetase
MMGKKVRTRFAPSPTGYLHVGGARTALFNYLYARAQDGEFILRIEDTDQERSTVESYQLMLESLKWLGLDWDEGPLKEGKFGPYKQSERLSIYKDYTERLISEKKAYRCFCTPEELDLKKKRSEAMGVPSVYDGKCRHLSPEEIEEKIAAGMPFTIRFQIPGQEVVVNDLVQGVVRFDSALIGDFIIVKSDGFPSYNYAVVIDDYTMEISHVIRGVGHLSNTPRQILIYRAFGWVEPNWAHVSEIVGRDHKKLSKRKGSTSITAFRDLGYSSESFKNYMALLGWAPQDGAEFMSTEEIIEKFDIARCNKSPSMFDVFDITNAVDIDLSALSSDELVQYLYPKSKMNWLSNQHIRAIDKEHYFEKALDYLSQINYFSRMEVDPESARLHELVTEFQVYLDRMGQLPEMLDDFFSEFTLEKIDESARVWIGKDFFAGLHGPLFKEINLCKNDWTESEISNILGRTSEKTGIKGKNLFMGARVCCTGRTTGFELPKMLRLMGKEETLQRLALIEKLIT